MCYVCGSVYLWDVYFRNKAEQVLQKSNDITKALDEADLMKKDVDEMLSDNTNEIQNFEDNLAGVNQTSP